MESRFSFVFVFAFSVPLLAGQFVSLFSTLKANSFSLAYGLPAFVTNSYIVHINIIVKVIVDAPMMSIAGMSLKSSGCCNK